MIDPIKRNSETRLYANTDRMTIRGGETSVDMIVVMVAELGEIQMSGLVVGLSGALNRIGPSLFFSFTKKEYFKTVHSE